MVPWLFGSVERPSAVSAIRHNAMIRSAITAAQSAMMPPGLADNAPNAPD